MNWIDESVEQEQPGIWSRIGIAAVATLAVAFLFAVMSPAFAAGDGEAKNVKRDDDTREIAFVADDDDDDDDDDDSNSKSKSSKSNSANTKTGTTRGTGKSKSVTNSSGKSANTKTGTTRGTGPSRFSKSNSS